MADQAVVADDSVDLSRRKFLTRAAIATGAVGAAFAAVPFIESWAPSERARAQGAPTELDLSKLEAGQMATPVWRRSPIYVVRRTPDMVARIAGHDAQLKDPNSEHSDQPAYAKNAVRGVIDWLVREKSLTREDAYVLCSLAVDLKISQIVDAPNWGVSAYLALSVFTKETPVTE